MKKLMKVALFAAIMGAHQISAQTYTNNYVF